MLNRISPAFDKLLKKKTASEKIDLTSDKPTIRPKAAKSRSFEAVLIFVNFNETSYLEKMEKMTDILFSYSLPEKTFKTTILYKSTRSLVRSPKCNTEFFSVAAEVLPIYQYQNYILRVAIDSEPALGLTLNKHSLKSFKYNFFVIVNTFIFLYFAVHFSKPCRN